MSRQYLDKSRPRLGYYEVFTGPQGARFQWTEFDPDGFEIVDHGTWLPTVEQAWLEAANDWDENGSSTDSRFSGRLNAAATRARKAAST